MRLRISGEYLDLYRNEIIAQTFAVNEIGSLETRQGGFSNDFNLPLSSKNRRLLGFPDNINSFSRSQYRKIDAILEDGSNNIYGSLRIRNAVGKNCEATFFTDNIGWFSLIKDRSIRDLDLSEYDHVYNQANIIASFENTEGYIYPLVDYQGGFRDRVSLEADVTEMFPAVYVHTLVHKIFDEIGWKIEGELITDPLFNRLVLPFSLESMTRNTSFIEDNTTQEVKDTTQEFTSIGLITWSGLSTQVENDTVDDVFNVDVTLGILDLNIDEGQLAFIAKKNGTEPISSLFVNMPFTGTVVFRAQGVQLDVGDYITVEVATIEIAQVFITTITSNVLIYPTTSAAAGGNVILSNTLPDLSQEDLMTYIAFTFGIVPQANVLSKTVSLDYFRSIPKNLLNAIDWSNKIDVSEDTDLDFTELIQGLSKTELIKYEEDDDDAELTAYFNEVGTYFGNGRIDIDNEHLSGTGTIYEAPFAPMINVNTFTNRIYIPQIFGDQARIGIIILDQDVPDLTNETFDELTITQEGEYEMTSSSIPFMWFAKTSYIPDIDSYTDSLVFSQVAFPNVVGDPLIEIYLQDYVNILNTPATLRQRVKLSSVDISALNFLTPIYIDKFKAYFYLNKINDYRGGLTECELVKVSGRILPLIDAGGGDQDYRITDDELLRLLDNGGFRILA